MQVHHSKLKQALAMGCYVSMPETRKFRMYWPAREFELFGTSINELFDEMAAVQNILNTYDNYKIINADNMQIILMDNDGQQMVGTPMLPTKVWATIEADEDEWEQALNGRPNEKHEDEAHIHGVHKSGALAYKEGVPASDCPFEDGTPEFAQWNDEWDAEADKEVGEGEDNGGVGSVVTNRYRAAYSESGHPTHCGDELAILLNNLCLNKAGINLELFEAICEANGVNLSRYNRTTKGWQGRLRMTGRNLLAKRVRENEGLIYMPEGMSPNEYHLSYDWVVQAKLKFKPKTEQLGP